MNKNLLCLFVVVIILVALHLSVAYKSVRSLKHYPRKSWGYRRPQWQRFSYPPKRPFNKRRPQFHYPPQRRPPRSHHVDKNREPFTIEFELPVENYSSKLKNDYQNDDNDDDYYTLDDYIDQDYVDDRQIRVQIVKESEKRLRIKLSRNDNFGRLNKLSTNGSNY